MKNELLRDAAIVFATWFVVAYVASGFPFTLLPSALSGLALIWLVGLAAGLAVTWFQIEGGVLYRRRSLNRLCDAQSDDAQAKIMDADSAGTLYEMPLPRIELPDLGRVKGCKLHELDWWQAYRKAHPQYAAIVMDVYGIMESKPGIPASPGGGHGGLSLIDHSLNVVAAILRLAPNWRFNGIVNKSGKVLVPLQDGPTELRIAEPTAHGTPLLPLLAFAHDIGKVACYTLKAGKVVSEIPGHGERGAALLRRLDSVQALPMIERDTLLLAVEFYHHLSNMPAARWINDTIRSFTALLYVADCEASDGEGDKTREAEEARWMYLGQRVAPAPTPPAPAQSPASAPPAPISGAGPEEPDALAALHTADQSSAPAASPAPGALAFEAESGASALDVFMDIITTPGSVNGKSKRERVAWKHGEWIFVQVGPLLEQAAEVTGDLALADVRSKRSADFVGALLHMLGEKDALLLSQNGDVRQPADAIWEVRSSSTDAAVGGSNPYRAIIVSTTLAPHLPGLADCPYAPTIIEPRLAEQPGQASEPAAAEDQAAPGDPFALLDAIDPMTAAPQEHHRSPSARLPALPAGFQLASQTAARKPQSSPESHPRATPKPITSMHNKTLISADILRSLIRTGATEYGVVLRQVGTTQVAVFDADLVAKAFHFDPKNLPDGVQYIAEKRRLVVTP